MCLVWVQVWNLHSCRIAAVVVSGGQVPAPFRPRFLYLYLMVVWRL